MPHPILNRSTLHTLRYLRRGEERLPGQFWLANGDIPRSRLARLCHAGLIETTTRSKLDLYRITPLGIETIEGCSN